MAQRDDRRGPGVVGVGLVGAARVDLFAGLFRFQFLVDHGGTPTDPDDDEEIEGSFEILQDTAGRAGRDFCDDIHDIIG